MFDCKHPYICDDITPQVSYEGGRRICLIRQDHQDFYAKYQCTHHNVLGQGWLKEKYIYHHYTDVLPHQWSIVNGYEALVLPKGDLIFDSSKIVDEFVLKALYALDNLHQKGWVHGDIKKQHFVIYQNRVYLIDFEHTQRIGHQNLQTHATPRYMAPELFHAYSKTPQTDLYALGIVLYEWLTQTRLKSRSYYDWAIFHCQTPLYLNSFVEKLLNKDRNNRFKSAQEAILAFKSL